VNIQLVNTFEPSASSLIWLNPGTTLSFAGSTGDVLIHNLLITVGTTGYRSTLVLCHDTAFTVNGHLDVVGAVPELLSTVKSCTPGTYAEFNVLGTATNHVCGCSEFIDVDQSGGDRELQTWLGGVTHSKNIRTINRSVFTSRGLSIRTTS
jgi:hypothetical protein